MEKIGYFELSEKVGYYFFPNLFYIESLYYLFFSCTDPIFGQSLAPEIFAKMF